MMEYQVGGSLKVGHPTYIERQADITLYEALVRGELCYVLTSRQMGKSSLRLRIRHRLESFEKGRCASLDLTRIGSENITLNQWYQGIAFELLRSFQLGQSIDLLAWWADQGNIPSVQKLGRFLEDIVLKNIPDEPLFILLDEIDTVQSLSFTVDDFFALIRYSYNQRAENPDYCRLRWALFGVASPADLIADVKRTPFNIGTAIPLTGFSFTESTPLLAGLVGLVDAPETLLHEILQWTQGQPFLTQKICQLAQRATQDTLGSRPLHPGNEAEWISHLVRSQVINNWMIQDEPEHLRTVQNYLLHDPTQTGRVLGLYQRILEDDTTKILLNTNLTHKADEIIMLLLSGLVVRIGDTLTVRNHIYQEVFSLGWVRQQLTELRPYATALAAWTHSGYEDESHLLQAQDLYQAQAWAMGKSLTDLDYQFLAASQRLERRRRERRIVETLTILHYREGELMPYLEQIAKAVSELTILDWSVVTFCRAEPRRILASSIAMEDMADPHYSLHDSLTAHVFRTGSYLVVEDTLTHPDYGAAPLDCRAYLGVPLRTSTGAIWGTICSFNRQPRQFDVEDVQLACIFAERAAAALENYELYQQLQNLNQSLISKLLRRNPLIRFIQWLKRILMRV